MVGMLLFVPAVFFTAVGVLLGISVIFTAIFSNDVNPYENCAVQTKQYTGKTTGGLKTSKRHEVVITWSCIDGVKTQVAWEAQ